MIHTNLYTKPCLILVFIFYPVAARKYDVEAEARRLYGQEFKSVLAKFRKTPDYLQILDEKYNEMTVFFSEVATYALQYTIDNKLKKKISEACNFEESTTVVSAMYYYKARGNMRQDEHQKNQEEPKTPQLLENILDQPKTSRNPIDLLEQYPHFKNTMTVQERNNIRDLAFEVTGQMIHMIIHSMGPAEATVKSTRLPHGGDMGEVKTTTEKDHRHTITKFHNEDYTQTSTTVNDPDASPVETYRSRYKSRTG